MDRNYDNLIDQTDLNGFLRDILHVEGEQITDLRICRLFKLLDRYKLGKIKLSDLRQILPPDATETRIID